MSDTEEETSKGYIPIRERPQWQDVTPIPQDDGPVPICAIKYTSQFNEIMSYFRAIIQRNEKTLRALKLTAEVIRLNAANYTVWWYRRRILFNDEVSPDSSLFNYDLRNEFQFISKIAEENPKNYQIWHHRRRLVERLNDASRELENTAYHLEDDNKNYHVWTHRQWVLEEYNLWEKELEYVDGLLMKDVQNNSAWNHREFVISKTDTYTDDICRREIGFVEGKLNERPDNSSAWNYLQGIMKGKVYAEFPQVEGLCRLHSGVAFASILLVAVLEQKNDKDSIAQAVNVIDNLLKDNKIKRKYWLFRQQLLLQRLT